jgi:hypothetical protein
MTGYEGYAKLFHQMSMTIYYQIGCYKITTSSERFLLDQKRL